ncbi:MAG: cupin domain-containing protein [Acidimicrobiales bacterium]
MHIAKQDVPVKIDVPGAKARQTGEFGSATGYGSMAGEYFSLGAGTDIAPLLKGLEGDGCQAPHWGYLLTGDVIVTYTDGQEEHCAGGDLFYWPPGHTVRVQNDAEVVLFSPLLEHSQAMNHMIAVMAQA